MTFEWGFNLLYYSRRGLLKRPSRLLLSANGALVQQPGLRLDGGGWAEQGKARGGPGAGGQPPPRNGCAAPSGSKAESGVEEETGTGFGPQLCCPRAWKPGLALPLGVCLF